MEDKLLKQHFDCIKNFLKDSTPSDLVRLDRKADLEIMNFWSGEELWNVQLPADLLVANTIPIKDLAIEFDERNTKIQFGKNSAEASVLGEECYGCLTKVRIKIFDNYVNSINYLQSDEAAKRKDVLACGAMEIEAIYPKQFSHLNIGKIIVPFYATYECNYLYGGVVYSVKNDFYFKCTHRMLSPLITWYGIQIMLLHPQLKTIFSHPQQKLIYDSKSTPHHKRITKYIKTHYIRSEDIDVALNNEDKKIHRKTLAWYVIGHWRHLKSGKRIFIQGYWKGELRDLKKNLDECRERIIVNPTI